MNLWVDDLRVPAEGWTWAKTSDEAIAILRSSKVELMSLDHDLGGDDTTRPVILWLCEHPDRWPATVRIHSMNPVGRHWLSSMVERYQFFA